MEQCCSKGIVRQSLTHFKAQRSCKSSKGGGGLGKEILEALQYAAKGPGLLAGIAILFVAMVMDRIVQGAFQQNKN